MGTDVVLECVSISPGAPPPPLSLRCLAPRRPHPTTWPRPSPPPHTCTPSLRENGQTARAKTFAPHPSRALLSHASLAAPTPRGGPHHTPPHRPLPPAPCAPRSHPPPCSPRMRTPYLFPEAGSGGREVCRVLLLTVLGGDGEWGGGGGEGGLTRTCSGDRGGVGGVRCAAREARRTAE